MITKKRYLELKKRRKELHFALYRSKVSVRYYLREKTLSSTVDSRFNYQESLSINRRLKNEYNLITELIDSTKQLLSIKQTMEAKQELARHIRDHIELAKNDTILDTHEDHLRMHYEMGGFS